MFHHDPLHSDRFLDGMAHEVLARWRQMGGRARRVELAAERRELEVLPAPAPGDADPTPAPAGSAPPEHPVVVGSVTPRRAAPRSTGC